ncbi:MAG: SDR family oxidoreductase [Reichenbachiella sp.]|uniref:SDR family NAD(P)-dependent oxidoreductase n=1 Tax=Reichenbachiella sp. TaxID=2184521 RepID=UPI003264B3E0
MMKDKVAVVTGGARDIGKAVSKKLASEGAKVVINYFDNKDQAVETLTEIKAEGGEAILVQGDMTKQADIDKLVHEAREAYGDEIHCLVNIAGGLVGRKTIEEMDEDFFNFVLRLNLTSTFLVTKAIVPYMPNGSSIVNFASQAGRDGGGPGAVAYSTAKGAVMTFTRGLAKELGPKNIRVNALCPGMISTTFHDTFTKDEVRKNVAAGTPLRREGEAGEVANLVACLASAETSFVTGTNIDINGGLFFS